MIAPPLPRVAQIEPIGRCNLACRMCTVNARTDAQSAMTLERFVALLDQMPQLEAVHLQGLGEPFMNPAFLDLVEAAVARGLIVSTNTNATLITRARAARLVESGIESVSISLDGATADVYEAIRVGASFSKVVRNVRRLVAARKERGLARPSLRFVMVLMRRNLADVPALITLAAQCGVEAVLVQRLASSLGEPALPAQYLTVKHYVADAELAGDEDLANATTIFEEARQRARSLGVTLHLPRLTPRDGEPFCDWPSREIYVTAAGDLLPCCMVATPDRGTFGNVGSASVEAVWRGEVAQSFRSALASPAPPAVCRGCALYQGRF